VARIRSTHPGSPKDEKVATLSIYARYAWDYLPCHADRDGRLKDDPFRLKIEILPLDQVDFGSLLEEMAAHELIIRYRGPDGRRYIQIRNFSRWQKPHKDEKSLNLPAPEGWDIEPPNRAETGTDRETNLATGLENGLTSSVNLAPGSGQSGSGKISPLAGDPTTQAPGSSSATNTPPAASGAALAPFREPRRVYPVGAVTLPFLAVYERYPNGAGKLKAAGVWQELAEMHPRGELGLQADVLAWFDTGILREHPYAGEYKYQPHLEKVLAEQRWLDRSTGPPNGSRTKADPDYEILT
jgi:hypothetical protein